MTPFWIYSLKLPKGAEVGTCLIPYVFTPNYHENKCMHTTCQAPISWIPDYY